MVLLSLPITWAVISLSILSAAQKQCPTQAPSGTCNAATFSSVLSSFGASLETIGIVPRGGCFREASYRNIASRDSGRDNYAANVGGSCGMIVKSGTYRFGLLLPDDSTWSGSFLTVGNYAFAGGINWIDMGPGVSIYGMATMSTDTGHNSSESNMAWAKGNTQAQEDWGWRAMNGSVAIAKKMTDAYYSQFSRQLSFSYYSGCSTGGRQGLKQIQVDQSSFNGVLVGAPAWEQYGLMPWIGKLGNDYANAGANGSFTLNQWYGMIIQIRTVCDLNDSVADNIISRPDLCSFDAIAADYLSCSGQFAIPGFCLNPSQIPTAAKFYKDYIVGGDTAFHAPELGSEADIGLTGGYLNGPAPTGFDREWAKNFLGYPDSYTFSDSAYIDGKSRNPGGATADAFRIDQFSQSRGKIIMYQGLADGIIPAKGTTKYYEQTKSQMGGDINSFFRYFQVPGMHHCWLSDTDNDPAGANYFAPWMFGGGGQAGITPTAESSQVLRKPEFDAFAALQQWVETAANDPNALGPSSITATTWFTGNQSVWRQRPLCAYPQRAVLTAGAAPNLKGSWSCSSS
jgi:feruloyl esterase